MNDQSSGMFTIVGLFCLAADFVCVLSGIFGGPVWPITVATIVISFIGIVCLLISLYLGRIQ